MGQKTQREEVILKKKEGSLLHGRLEEQTRERQLTGILSEGEEYNVPNTGESCNSLNREKDITSFMLWLVLRVLLRPNYYFTSILF